MVAQNTTFCPRCGAERPAAASFCSKCGTKMTPPTVRAGAASYANGPPPTSSATASHVPSSPTARRKVGLWLWTGAVVLVGGMLRVLLFHHDLGNGGLPSNPFGPRPLATSLRQFQQGDSWEYRVSGTASLPSGRTGTITDGTLREAITGLKIAEFNNLTEANDINLTFSDGSRTLPFSHSQRENLSQNLVGNTYLMSDNDGPQGAVRTVRQPQVDTPGVWSSGLTQKSHLDFGDGESRDEITTVQGSEVVETALGKFTVWRCTQDETDSDGTKTATALWFAPQLGIPVKTSGTTRTPDGMVMTLTTELTKTSIPL